MKHALIASLAGVVLFGLLIGCTRFGPQLQGSGVAKTETREVADFERIRLDGAAKINVQIGPQRALEVSGDDNVVPIIKTELRGDTLVISSTESYSTRLGITVTITTPQLAGVEINGSGDVTVKDLKSAKFAAIIRGSGDVKVNGSADELTAEIRGSGDLRLVELEAKQASVSVAGSGDASVNVIDELTVSVAGSGDIRYKGSPKVHKTIAGSGSVKPMGG